MSLHVVYGAGPLGLSVARALLEKGETVRLINRSGRPDIAPQAGLETVAGNATDRAFNNRMCANAEVVYQCAATAYTVAAWRDELSALQTHIVDAAAVSGARLVVGDNLYMYGVVQGAMREDTPDHPCSEKGKIRARLATEILTAHAVGKLRASIVRGSDFFGPHVLNSIVGERVVLPALQGKRAFLLGNIDSPHSLTFIEDFGRAMSMVGADDAAMGQIWHVPNAPTITQREMAALLFTEIGRPIKIGAMGKTMMRIGGLFVPAAWEAMEMMYQFEQPFVVDHSKFIGHFGDIATPHVKAISRTVDWYCAKFAIARNRSRPNVSVGDS